MTRILLFLLVFCIRQSFAQMPPVVPLTNALTAVYCHTSNQPGIMQIRCGPNEKIRMLDAFDAAVKNSSHLPIQCLRSSPISKESTGVDCKVHTSFTSACTGRENCTLHMQRIRLNSPADHCHNELVDYTMAFFECISDAFIHDVCSPQAITSPWGTLQTPNFPNPYTSSDDCWCKLSTQLQHRLLLSIIVFQLIPYDQHCAGAGLYVQSSNEQRSTQCTYLQQGHNYLSDSNSLYINFYSRTPTVRGGFWIIYEASYPAAEVHLHCGPRDKIGVPASSVSVAPPSFSTASDHGWSRLAFNNPPNPTAAITDHMIRMRMPTSTPRSSSINVNPKINTSTAVGAFTYPHGALTTFNLAYGPKGWYVRDRSKAPNKTTISWLRISTPHSPVVRWSSTWPYRPSFETKPSTTAKTTITTTTTTTTTSESTTTSTSTTTPTTTTSTTTTTVRTATAHRRLLFTHKPWIYHIVSSFRPSTRIVILETATHSTTRTTLSTASISTRTTAVPIATPWYSPAGPYDWWQWQWYTTKSSRSSINVHSTTHLSTTSVSAVSTTRRTTTTTTSTMTTVTTTSPSTTVTTSTTTTTTTVSTARPSEKPTNSTQIITAIDWFRTSSKAPSLQGQLPPSEFDDVYSKWAKDYAASKTRTTMTSTSTSNLVSISPRQEIDMFSTKPNWKVITINTPPEKRYHSQQYPGVSERNAVGMTNTAEAAPANVRNMIRRVIEQRNKKNSMEYGWLSKTDMTIVAVSILFVILLAVINLILFAVRRHRHRAQSRHLLSTSIPSLLNDRRLGGNGHSRGLMFTDPTNSLTSTTNNNDDILPAVGEIVIWDEKDQGGYMIDNNGAWAKIEGRQWFGSNLFKSCTKSSLSKSFRSRFRLMRHGDKKGAVHLQPPITPKTHPTPQQAFKFPLLMDTATLSPVPEADDYDSSEMSLSDVIIRSSVPTLSNSNWRHQKHQLLRSGRKHDQAPQNAQQTATTIQALIHTGSQLNDNYYKRVGTSGDDSNYTVMPENVPRESSLLDQETDRSLGNEIDTGGSMHVSVPTMIRRDDDAGTNTDEAGSIYNPRYSIQSLTEYPLPNYLQPNANTGPFFGKPSISTFKPTPNNSVVVGLCQAEFQSLDPTLLFKSATEQQPFYRSSQSMPLSTYDSGFVDEQTIGSFAGTNGLGGSESNLTDERRDRHISGDDILLTKSEDDDDDDQLPMDAITTNEFRNSNGQKWRPASKRVSFQEEHVTQRFSPPPYSFNTITHPETSSSPFDTYDMSADLIQSVPPAPPLLKSFLPPSTTGNFTEHSPTASGQLTAQKQITSIDNEDTTQNVIMNHLHSVKSLKKFFETKMVVQRPAPATQSGTVAICFQPISTNDDQKEDRTLVAKEPNAMDELEQRQEMMNRVLESLKKKKAYSRTTNDTPDPTGRYTAMTTSSYDSNITQNLPVHRHYSRRFRSSSTSNNSLHPGGNIITHINLSNAHYAKRAHSQDRHHYQSTDHHLGNTEKWKQEPQRQLESDEEDNISENSMLWQARTKLNEFVTRTRRNQQQSPYYSACANGGTPSEEIYAYDDHESVTVETRF